jgi:hypothetical protein
MTQNKISSLRRSKSTGRCSSAGSGAAAVTTANHYHLLGAMRRIEERDRQRFAQPPNELNS